MEEKTAPVFVPLEMKQELDSLKIIPEEPYYKLLRRIIDFYKENHKD